MNTMSAAASPAMREFLREQHSNEIECVIADMTGIARGKILPKDLFLSGEHMRLPKSVLFRRFIGGREKYVPPATVLFARHVNSFRRPSRFQSAPTSVRRGYDNRTCGIRIPNADPAGRRVENRVPGVDVNPYLAMAATLACGWLGMVEGVQPSGPTPESAEHIQGDLPRNLEDAIGQLRGRRALAGMLGPLFVAPFCEVKELEFATFARVIGSWEREHPMLLV
jgi:glutamine synthetase